MALEITAEEADEPFEEIQPCGSKRKIPITDLLEVTVKCEYVEHSKLVDHQSTDERTGYKIIYRWR